MTGTPRFGGLYRRNVARIWLLPQHCAATDWSGATPEVAEALPDTVDLLGIVLGTGLALDQAMMRVSEEMEFIYPDWRPNFPRSSCR